MDQMENYREMMRRKWEESNKDNNDETDEEESPSPEPSQENVVEEPEEPTEDANEQDSEPDDHSPFPRNFDEDLQDFEDENIRPPDEAFVDQLLPPRENEGSDSNWKDLAESSSDSESSDDEPSPNEQEDKMKKLEKLRTELAIKESLLSFKLEQRGREKRFDSQIKRDEEYARKIEQMLNKETPKIPNKEHHPSHVSHHSVSEENVRSKITFNPFFLQNRGSFTPKHEKTEKRFIDRKKEKKKEVKPKPQIRPQIRPKPEPIIQPRSLPTPKKQTPRTFNWNLISNFSEEEEEVDITTKKWCRFGLNCRKCEDVDHLKKFLHPCRYGKTCRKNQDMKHLNRFVHSCRYGGSCYRKNERHKLRFSHPNEEGKEIVVFPRDQTVVVVEETNSFSFFGSQNDEPSRSHETNDEEDGFVFVSSEEKNESDFQKSNSWKKKVSDGVRRLGRRGGGSKKSDGMSISELVQNL